jgi:AcrR family transcriptional regulator
VAHSKKRFDNEKKRADIMQKALKLFLEKGFEGTSMNDICFSAKLTKPSLYHYFESKNHLLFSVHMRAIENILHPYLDEVTMIAEPDKRLEAMIRGYTKMICSHPELRFILHGSLLIKDKYYAEIRKEWKKFYLLLRDTISELRQAGRIDKDLRASWTALLLLGMITWTTFWFDYKKKDQIDGLADSTVRLTFEGVGLRTCQIDCRCPQGFSEKGNPDHASSPALSGEGGPSLAHPHPGR